MKPHQSLVYYDTYSYEHNGNLREFVENSYIHALLESVQKQCILVLGGDGTMLRAIAEHAEKDLPFLGVNFGHKGFLLNSPKWIFPEIGNFQERHYPLLEVRKNTELLSTAFNDIHLYSSEGKALELEI